jgi:hypothetical protein
MLKVSPTAGREAADAMLTGTPRLVASKWSTHPVADSASSAAATMVRDLCRDGSFTDAGIIPSTSSARGN